MANAIEMDSDLDDDLKYYGEVCEMFDGLSDDTSFSSDGNDNDVLEEESDEMYHTYLAYENVYIVSQRSKNGDDILSNSISLFLVFSHTLLLCLLHAIY